MSETASESETPAVVRPMFPLATYPDLVREMTIKNMKPEDLFQYTFSSRAAAQAVQMANIQPEDGYRVHLDRDCVSLKVGFNGYHVTVEIEETDRGKIDKKSFSITTVTGETFRVWYIPNGRCNYHLYTSLAKVNEAAAIVDNHFRTVFPWMRTVSFDISCMVSESKAREFFTLTQPRVVGELNIQAPPTFETLRLTCNWAKPTKKFRMDGAPRFESDIEDVSAQKINISGCEWLTDSQFFQLNSPNILIHGPKSQITVEKIRFWLMSWINESPWKSRDTLELLEIKVASLEYKMEDLLKDFGAKEWDPKVRDGCKCVIVNDKVVEFYDLRKGMDIQRKDGRLATLITSSFLAGARMSTGGGSWLRRGGPRPYERRPRCTVHRFFLHVWHERFADSADEMLRIKGKKGTHADTAEQLTKYIETFKKKW